MEHKSESVNAPVSARNRKKKLLRFSRGQARHLPPPGAPPSTANQCAPSPILFPPEQLHRRPGTQAHPRARCQRTTTIGCAFALKPTHCILISFAAVGSKPLSNLPRIMVHAPVAIVFLHLVQGTGRGCVQKTGSVWAGISPFTRTPTHTHTHARTHTSAHKRTNEPTITCMHAHARTYTRTSRRMAMNVGNTLTNPRMMRTISDSTSESRIMLERRIFSYGQSQTACPGKV